MELVVSGEWVKLNVDYIAGQHPVELSDLRQDQCDTGPSYPRVE